MKKKGNLCFNEAADCGILIEEGGISGVLWYRRIADGAGLLGF